MATTNTTTTGILACTSNTKRLVWMACCCCSIVAVRSFPLPSEASKVSIAGVPRFVSSNPNNDFRATHPFSLDPPPARRQDDGIPANAFQDLSGQHPFAGIPGVGVRKEKKPMLPKWPLRSSSKPPPIDASRNQGSSAEVKTNPKPEKKPILPGSKQANAILQGNDDEKTGKGQSKKNASHAAKSERVTPVAAEEAHSPKKNVIDHRQQRGGHAAKSEHVTPVAAEEARSPKKNVIDHRQPREGGKANQPSLKKRRSPPKETKKLDAIQVSRIDSTPNHEKKSTKVETSPTKEKDISPALDATDDNDNETKDAKPVAKQTSKKKPELQTAVREEEKEAVEEDSAFLEEAETQKARTKDPEPSPSLPKNREERKEKIIIQESPRVGIDDQPIRLELDEETKTPKVVRRVVQHVHANHQGPQEIRVFAEKSTKNLNQSDQFMLASTKSSSYVPERNLERWKSTPGETKVNSDPVHAARWQQIDKYNGNPNGFEVARKPSPPEEKKKLQQRMRDPAGHVDGQPDRLDRFMQDPLRSQASLAKNPTQWDPTKYQAKQRHSSRTTKQDTRKLVIDQPDTLDKFMWDPMDSNASPVANRAKWDPSMYEVHKQRPARPVTDHKRMAGQQPDQQDQFMNLLASQRKQAQWDPTRYQIQQPTRSAVELLKIKTTTRHQESLERYGRDPLHSTASQADRFRQDPSRFEIYSGRFQKRQEEEGAAPHVDGTPDALGRFLKDPAADDASQAKRSGVAHFNFKGDRAAAPNKGKTPATIDDEADDQGGFLRDPADSNASQSDRFGEDPTLCFQRLKRSSLTSKKDRNEKTDGQPDSLERFVQDPASTEGSQADSFWEDPIKFQRLQQVDRLQKDPGGFEVWKRTAKPEQGKQPKLGDSPEEKQEIGLINYWPSHLLSTPNLQGQDPNHQQWEQVGRFKEEPRRFQVWQRPPFMPSTEIKASEMTPVTAGPSSGTCSLQFLDPNFHQWQQLERFMVDPSKFRLWKPPSTVDLVATAAGDGNASPATAGDAQNFDPKWQQVRRYMVDPAQFQVWEKPRAPQTTNSARNTQADQDNRFIWDPRGWQSAQADRMMEDPTRSTIPQIDRFKDDPSSFQRWRPVAHSRQHSQPDQGDGFVENPYGFQSQRFQRWEPSRGRTQPDQADGFVGNPFGANSIDRSVPGPEKLMTYRKFSTRDEDEDTETPLPSPRSNYHRSKPEAPTNKTKLNSHSDTNLTGEPAMIAKHHRRQRGVPVDIAPTQADQVNDFVHNPYGSKPPSTTSAIADPARLVPYRQLFAAGLEKLENIASSVSDQLSEIELEDYNTDVERVRTANIEEKLPGKELVNQTCASNSNSRKTASIKEDSCEPEIGTRNSTRAREGVPANITSRDNEPQSKSLGIMPISSPEKDFIKMKLKQALSAKKTGQGGRVYICPDEN